jgi:hypothetical protein
MMVARVPSQTGHGFRRLSCTPVALGAPSKPILFYTKPAFRAKIVLVLIHPPERLFIYA